MIFDGKSSDAIGKIDVGGKTLSYYDTSLLNSRYTNI